jgi:hypothetical protein
MKHLADVAQRFIERDDDGAYILDYLGEKATCGIERLAPDLRGRAEKFLHEKAEHWGKSGKPDRAGKYAAALRYFAKSGQRSQELGTT